MQLNRSALHRLKAWKSDNNRKPLLIRGARQVGKTTLVRAFSKMFPVYIELNLEKEAEKSLFEIDNTSNLISAIYLYKNVVPKNQPTLIFIDEIQESVKAIKQLRYFYEESPDLYIIAAGSLLEFALSKTANFPVGRIDYLYLHPLNFSEYLMALGNEAAIEVYEQIPAPEFAHDILINLFNQYALIGGMPEIVYNYLQTENLAALSIHYKKLWQSYKDDVEKYGQNDTEKKVIRHVIETAPGEKDRIKFEGFGHSNYRSREVGEAIRALDKAKLIQLKYPTTNLTPPIVSNYKKRPRLQFIDTGILNQALDLQIEMINLKALDHLYQGRVLQHLVTQELISIHQDSFYKPHFWVRESKDSNAEVDLVFQHHQYLIPIEVKSGSTGTLRSLHQFVDRSDHHFAIRIYSGKFIIEKAMTPKGKPFYLMNLPYFAAGKIMQYIKYFFEQKPM